MMCVAKSVRKCVLQCLLDELIFLLSDFTMSVICGSHNGSLQQSRSAHILVNIPSFANAAQHVND